MISLIFSLREMLAEGFLSVRTALGRQTHKTSMIQRKKSVLHRSASDSKKSRSDDSWVKVNAGGKQSRSDGIMVGVSRRGRCVGEGAEGVSDE